MTQLWYGTIAAMLATTITTTDSSTLSAQQMPAELSVAAHDMVQPVMQTQTNASAVWNKVIALDLDGVTLEEALEAIGKAAGVDVTYSRNVIPYKNRVTVQSGRVAVREAFRLSLQGTGTEARLSPAGSVIIARARDSQTAQGLIRGRIVHAKTKQPVVGATILVDDEPKGVTTGSDGSFRISADVGERRITVRAVGFVRQVKTVTATEGETVTIEVALEPSASVLDEVVVTGTVVATARKEISTPITVIHGEELERRGITRIEQLFRGEIPGVFAKDRGIEAYESYGFKATASDVYVRGSSNLSSEGTPTPLKTYVDGVEIADPAHLGLIDPQSIERIEVITGPQAATIYGSGAMGGVMQIFTKKGTVGGKPEFVVNARMGWLENNFSNGRTPTHNHSVMANGMLSSEITYALTGTYVYSGQWQPNLFSQRGGASMGLTYNKDRLNMSGSVSATLGRNGTTPGGVSNPVFFSKIAVGEWWPGRLQTVSLSSTRASQSSNLLSLSVNYRRSHHWQHSVTFGRNSNAMNSIPQLPTFSSASDSLYRSRKLRNSRTTASYNTTWSPDRIGVTGFVITAGASGSFGDQLAIDGCHVSESTNPYFSCYTSGSLLTYGVARGVSDNSAGLFSNLRVGFFEKLYTTFAVRAERNSSYGNEYKVDWTPTNGITYTEELGNLTVKLLASYGRSTRAPQAEQRDQITSTANQNYTPTQWITQKANLLLRPEYSRGPQGGIEVYVGNRGSIAINRYVQEITDLIASVVVDSIKYRYNVDGKDYMTAQYQNVNIGAIRSHGWEGQGALHLGPLSLKGTYSWNDSRIKYTLKTLSNGSYEAGGTFYRLPTHMGNVTASYALGGTNITAVSNWIGRSINQGGDHIVYQENLRNRYSMYVQRVQNSQPYFQNVPPFSQKGYIKTDISALHRITPRTSVTVNIINVGNNFQSDAGLLNPTLGRQTNIGVSFRYR